MGWFNLKAIREETKKVRWPKRKAMLSDTRTVIIFIAVFLVFFIAADSVIGIMMRLLGVL